MVLLPRSSLFESTAHCCRASPVCLVAFCLGICSTLTLTNLLDYKYLAVAIIFTVYLAIRSRHLTPALFFLLGLTWASLRFDMHASQPFPDEFEGLDIRITATVIDLPTNNHGDWRFRARVDSVAEQRLKPILGKRLQLSCYRCPTRFSAGQQWAFTVRLKRPHGYASPGAFDYERYLFRHSIIARGYVRTKDPQQLIGVKSHRLARWREAIRTRLQTLDDGVGRNMIAALTIGDKSGFTHQQKKVFQETGVSHLMAISGLHIGLVFLFTGWLSKWLLWPFARLFEQLPRQHLVLLPAMTAAVFYAGLAGFAVSTQRAMIMLSVFVICKLSVRDPGLMKVLLISVTILLIYDPFSIMDVGFWLSAGAVFIIALCADKNDSLIRLQPRLWLGMLPLTNLFFGQVSLVSPIVNLVMVPLFCTVLIPITLFALVLTNLGLPELGLAVCSALSSIFDVVYDCLRWISSWSYARWHTTPFALWQWLMLGILLALEISRYRWRAIGWLALLISLFINPLSSIGDNQLKVALLDVGQGLAMVIRTANSVTVYDTGPRYGSGFSVAEAVLIPYLRYHGVRKVDHLIISHADNDHIGGLRAVVESVPVDQVLTSRVDKIPNAQNCQAGQQWTYDQSKFVVISPDSATPDGSNNHSCVLMIEHAGTRILISGDIEKQVERYLLKKLAAQREHLRADILLVPHQGSRTSSTADFLDAVDPELALVAAGYRNHYGHPHQDVQRRYLERGVELLSTIDFGTIEITVDESGSHVRRFRVSKRRFWNYQKVPNQD